MSDVRELRRVDAYSDSEKIADALEALARDLREGREKARDAIVIWRDRENDALGYLRVNLSRTSDALGMLAFASQMIYALGSVDL